MNPADLSNFLKALDDVKNDFTCGVCSQLCKNPITLSKCFHIICSEHFESLKSCPKCGISLDGCTMFVDDQLGITIDSAKQLDEIFDQFKPKQEEELNSTKKRGKQKSLTGDSVKEPLKMDNTNKKRTKKNEVDEKDSKENTKSNQATTSDAKSKSENVNMSFLSTASSKFNKGIEKRNNKGETSLHIACRLGKIDQLTELLDQGANTNTKDNAGWTPLHEVVQNGRLDLVKLLLQYNTLINVPGQSNETPLHEAVRFNHKDIAEELVMNGADINARNCKGETPLQLASNEMKEVLTMASENIIQTQGVNVTIMSELHSALDFDDIRVFCTSQYRTVHNKLKVLAKSHNNLHIEPKLTKKVTHLIVDAEDGICLSSLDILQGIVWGCWILKSEWVTKSTEEKLESFHSYEVKGVGTTTYKGPNNSRYNKYKQLPGIFDGCHFYLHNFMTKYEISKTIVVTKAILAKLITDAGGVVLRRVPNPESIPDSEKLVPYHALKGGKLVNCSHYIIFKDMFEPMYNMSHLKALPIGWLIECIEKYELCEPW